MQSLANIWKFHGLKIVLGLYLISRLTNLTLLPIFADEANYLDWGWREVSQGRPWHSLYDAKQPLLMWLFGLFQLLPIDPLAAGRLVSVLFGIATLFGLYKISKSWLPSLLYTLTPLFLFYDRQALMEGPLVAVIVWTYYYVRRFLSQPHFKNSLILGILLGLGFFIKSTMLIFFLTTAAIIFLVSLLKPKLRYDYFTQSLVVCGAAIVVVLPLLFQPQFWSTFALNARYSLTLSQIIHLPWKHWSQIMQANWEVLFWHLTPPIFIAMLFGIYRTEKLLKLWVLIPFMLFSLTATSTNFRYLVPFVPLLLLPAAAVFSHHKRLLVFLTLPVLASILLLTKPESFFYSLAKVTKYSYIGGYVTGDSTGYQINQTVGYLRSISRGQNIIVGMALNAGNPEAALITYFKKDPQITTAYMDTQIMPGIEQYDCLSAQTPVYFVARNQQQGGLEKYLEPVIVIRNDYNPDFHTIYTLKKECAGKTLDLALIKTN